MPNLIAGEAVVPEFYQRDARPARVADALLARLDGPEAARQRERFAALRGVLGGGAARRTAAIAEEMIGASPAA